MGSRITVTVDLDIGGRAVAYSEDMPVWIVENGFRPVDWPSADAGAFGKMLCSDSVTVEATMKARNEIAAHLTKALLNAMGARDTRMGYPATNVQVQRDSGGIIAGGSAGTTGSTTLEET